jgi:hypothetical protein
MSTVIQLASYQAITARRLRQQQHAIDNGLDGAPGVLQVLEGRERSHWVQRLKKLERLRRRRQADYARHGVRWPGGTARVDVHGQHRIVVKTTTNVSLTDWIDDKFYPTHTFSDGDDTPIEAFTAARSEIVPPKETL